MFKTKKTAHKTTCKQHTEYLQLGYMWMQIKQFHCLFMLFTVFTVLCKETTEILSAFVNQCLAGRSISVTEKKKILCYFGFVILRYAINYSSCVLSILIIIQTFNDYFPESIAGPPNLMLTIQLKFYDKHNCHFTILYFPLPITHHSSHTDVEWKWNVRLALFSSRYQPNEEFHSVKHTKHTLTWFASSVRWRLIKCNSFIVEKTSMHS